jgi:hypothetical protein
MKSSKESKRQRFERIAQRRITEALHRLRLLGNLSNRATYDYSDEHVKQMLDALETELKQVRHRFRNEGSGQGQAFTFKR